MQNYFNINSNTILIELITFNIKINIKNHTITRLRECESSSNNITYSSIELLINEYNSTRE